MPILFFFAFTAISLGNSPASQKNLGEELPASQDLISPLSSSREKEGGREDPPFRLPQFHGATWNLYICGRPSPPRGIHKSACKSGLFIFFKYMCERSFLLLFIKRNSRDNRYICPRLRREKRDGVCGVKGGGREGPSKNLGKVGTHLPTHRCTCCRKGCERRENMGCKY